MASQDTIDYAQEFEFNLGGDERWLRFILHVALNSNRAKRFKKNFSCQSPDDIQGYVITGEKEIDVDQPWKTIPWTVKAIEISDGYLLTAEDEVAKEFLGLLHGLCPAAADSGVGARGYNISARSEEYSFNQEHIRKMLSNFDEVNGYKKLTDKLEKEINNKVEELKELTDFEKITDDELRAEAVKQISKAFTYDIQRGNEKLTVTYYKTGTLLTSTNNRELTAAFWQTFLDNCPEK